MNIFKQKTAVLIIDMQNGFLEKGAPIEVPNGRNIIPRIKELIAFSRKKSLQVIWTQVNIDLFKNTQYEQLFPTHFINGKNILEKGSRNYEIVDALSQLIESKDIIIEKDRYSAFIYTDLDLILRTKNIKTLVFSGVTTNVCVESIVRDAFQLSYNTVLLNDCTATFNKKYQKFSEEIISYVFGTVTNLTNFIKQKGEYCEN